VRREPLATLIWGKKGRCSFRGWERDRVSLKAQISDNGEQH